MRTEEHGSRVSPSVWIERLLVLKSEKNLKVLSDESSSQACGDLMQPAAINCSSHGVTAV